MLVAGLGITCSCHPEASSCEKQHCAAKWVCFHLLRLPLGEPHGARLFIEVYERKAFEQRQVMRPVLLTIFHQNHVHTPVSAL